MSINDLSQELTKSAADTRIALLAMIAAICVGEGSLLSMPYIIGGIVERFQLTESASGITLSLQFAAMGLVAIYLSIRVHTINRRVAAVIAGLFILLGHLIGVLSDSWYLFLFGRVMAGAGEGAALSIANAVAAGTQKPQRTFSILAIAMVVTAVAIYASMPVIWERAGPVSVYYVLSVLAIVTLPFLFGVPKHVQDVDDNPVIVADVWRPFPWILIGIGCLYVGGNSMWAYTERIGTSIGLSVATISAAFMTTVILSSLGPLIAHMTEKWWGNMRPIIFGALVHAAASLILATAYFKGMFFAGVILANVSFLFLIPYYRALTAFLDPLGRLTVGSVVVQTVGTAFAPLIGGLILLTGAGYAGVGAMAAFLAIASFALVMQVARKADVARSRANK